MNRRLVDYGLNAGFHWSGDAAQIERLLQGAVLMGGELFSGGKSEQDTPGPVVVNGTAIIRIQGVLSNKIPVAASDRHVTSYAQIIRQMRQALADTRAARIALVVDSPGGTIGGAVTTAREIRAIRARKPVTAYLSSWSAGSGILLAAQAEKVIAAPTAIVGGIGVFSVYEDTSKAYEDAGIKTHVIKFGDLKGMGVPGALITREMIAAEQQIVDSIAGDFIQEIAAGRGLSLQQVRQAATGRLWDARTAKAFFLVDAIEPILEQFS